MRPTLLLTITIAMLSMSSFAQSTARKFTLKNSADGQSELTVYLPSPDALGKSNGRVIVDCPGGAYNALRTVRDSAKVWHLNPNNVGIQGFSAGGHLASAVSTHAPMDVRPNFSILFYPVISMDERLTHKGSCVGFLGEKRKDEKLVNEWSSDKAVRRHLVPPTILILANDDRAVPPATNAAAYYTAMRKAGASCSMFTYPTCKASCRWCRVSQ